MLRVGYMSIYIRGPDFVHWKLGKALTGLRMFQLNTEIGVRKCPISMRTVITTRMPKQLIKVFWLGKNDS